MTVLTERDLALLRMCGNACWLTTRQIHRHYFPDVSINACQKRLRKLASGGFLFHARPSRTDQSLWRVGTVGLCRIQSEGRQTYPAAKRVPGNLNHFLAINELRLWFMRNFQTGSYRLKTFLAEWELKQGRHLQAIPDGLVVVTGGNKSLVIAIEVDLGTEGLAFFQKTKIENYRHFSSADLAEGRLVLVVVAGRSRMKAIAGRLYGQTTAEKFVVVEADQLLASNLETPILIPLFDKQSGAVCCSFTDLFDSPHRVSSREESPSLVSN